MLFLRQGNDKLEILSLDEFLALTDSFEVHGVTRDLQTMVDWHAKYIGLAGRRQMSEKELDRITKGLVREPKRDQRQEREIEQTVQELLKGV